MRKVDIQYLREFVALERIRNFTQAADELYTTEATLSRHIKAMEKELEQPLFLRTTRRIELTEFGRKFLVYAERIVDTWEDCSASLLKKDAHLGERLMIGIFGLISHYTVIQKALREFSTSNPECTVGTIQGDLTQLKEKLLKREYDLAIVRESTAMADDMFGRVTIMKEPLCVVVPKNDPLAQENVVNVLSLKGRSVTLPSEFMLSHRLFVDLCRKNGFEPKVRSILREREFMENFISIGNGITIMCENMAYRSFNSETQTVKFIAPSTHEYINLLYLKNATVSETIRHAVQCFEEASIHVE